MVKKITESDLDFFYEKYEVNYPAIILFKIIITFGLYVIWWFYKMNIKLEEVDGDAPSSKRGVIILLFLIPGFEGVLFVLEKLVFINAQNLLFIVTAIGWSLVIFLSLKYIYDFCDCFGKWTASSGLFWYLAIYPGYFSIILYFYHFYYALPLLFFSIITVPAMQAFLNIKERKFREMKEHNNFNRTAPAQANL